MEIEFPSPGLYEIPVGASIKRIKLRDKELPTDEAAIAKLIKADPSDIKAIAEAQLELSNDYYKNPLKQSQRSFLLMCIAAGVGFLFLLAAVVFFVLQKPAYMSYISTVSGIISGFISGIFSWLYQHASDQALAYKPQVDKIQNFIMANSACETMDEERKQKNREDLIRWLVDLSPKTSNEDKKA